MTQGETETGSVRRPRLSKPLQEVIVAALLVVFFAFFRLQVSEFIAGRRGRTYMDPDAWPAALLTLGLVLSLVYLVLSFMALRRHETRGATATSATDVLANFEDEAPAGTETKRPWFALSGLGVVVGFALLIPQIGFIPATFLFGVVFLLLLGERRWWLVLALPTVASAAIIGIFTQLLVVPLPRGVGPFLELSTWLY